MRPDLGQRLAHALSEHGRQVAMVLYVVGVAGFCLLPHLGRKTFLDENAFILDGARTRIQSTDSPVVSQRLRLGEEGSVPHVQAAVQEALQALAVETYWQPLPAGAGASTNCSNLHAVLCSARGDGKEAILLVTPLSDLDGASAWRQAPEGRALAVGAVYALLHFLEGAAPWLAKDVVWVLPDARCGLVQSMQWWVERYQQPELLSAQHDLSTDFGRAGAMQQALVLEVAGGGPFTALELSVEGYDGLLPKLDLFYVPKAHAERYHGFTTQLPGAHAPWKAAAVAALPPAAQRYASLLLSGAQFLLRCARGAPGGAHAAFKSFGVDAVTLRLVHSAAAKLPTAHGAVLPRTAALLEGVVRCLSNLQERLHHSSSMYLLFTPDWFVSVAGYAALPAALLASALVAAFAEAREVRRGGAAAGVGAAAGAGKADGGVAAVGGADGVACGGDDTASVAAGASSVGAAGRDVGGRGAGEAAAWVDEVSEWARAVAVVVAVHVACGTVGYGTQRLMRGCLGSSRWLAWVAAGSVVGGTAAAAVAAQQGGGVCRGTQRWRRVKVAALVAFAAEMEGLTCLNWAVAYVAMAALLPMALAAQPWRAPGGTLAAAAATFTSPLALLAAAEWAGGGGGGVAAWCGLTALNAGVAGGVYLPLWVSCVLIGLGM